MNKTLNEPQDLIENAQTSHGTAKVEDLEWIARLKRHGTLGLNVKVEVCRSMMARFDCW